MLWLESCYSGFDCLELLEESWSQIWLLQSVIAEHFYSRSMAWCNQSKPSSITHAPFISVWDIVCSQYLTSLGCYPLVTAFLPPLLSVTDCCLCLRTNMFHWYLWVVNDCKKDGGFGRAVSRPSTEAVVNGLQLLLIIWPGAYCCYKKLGGDCVFLYLESQSVNNSCLFTHDFATLTEFI